MPRTSKNFLIESMLFFIMVFTVMLYGGIASAGEYTLQTNLTEVADQLARWSKQSGTGQLTPEAQQKLSELLMQASQLLREMTMKGDTDMQREQHDKLQMMKEAWDPFDTKDRM